MTPGTGKIKILRVNYSSGILKFFFHLNKASVIHRTIHQNSNSSAEHINMDMDHKQNYTGFAIFIE